MGDEAKSGVLDYRQYFTINEAGVLHYADKPIPFRLLNRCKEVLDAHIVPNRSPRSLYEALIFCIGSQRCSFERPVSMMLLTHDATLDQLKNPDYLEEVRVKSGVLAKGRFADSFRFIDQYAGGIEKLASDYLEKPVETRKLLVKEVTWLAAKTASFWYLCLGGTQLMTLDVHNYRFMDGVGVPVDSHYHKGKVRKTDGRNVTTTPDLKKYELIESNVLDRFKDCKSVQNCASTDAALITALFWTVGAAMERGLAPLQQEFIERPVLPGFITPYSGKADAVKSKDFLERYVYSRKENKDKRMKANLKSSEGQGLIGFRQQL